MPHAIPTPNHSLGGHSAAEGRRRARARLTFLSGPTSLLAATAMLTVLVARPAQAAMPVIDIASITQLVFQVQTMAQQLTTARNQLSQAQSTLTAMTGNRGMQNLLAGTARNYLPADAQQLLSAMQNASATYSALATNIQSIRSANAVLTTVDLNRLTPIQRRFVEGARTEAATLDALTRSALNSTSGRFAALQQLIQAIGVAHDQKAVLDLQARIQAEQGMLQNESTKLDVLYHTAEAQRQERSQRVREAAIADVGSFRTLAPLHLTVAMP